MRRPAAADSRFDLSLRFLSLLVSGALVLALVWHFAGALTPLMRLGEAPLPAPRNAQLALLDAFGPPAWAASPSHAGPPASAAPPARTPSVTVFRCEQHGHVTYADRPCDQGGMRVLQLPRG